MKKLFTLVVLLTVASASYGQVTLLESVTYAGQSRQFRLYVPAVNACALVVHLHGYGSNSIIEQVYTGYGPVADTAGFIVAYPDGLVDPLGSQSWNVGWPLQVNNDDVGFLTFFIDSLVKRYNLDPSAVFVSGLSNGGFMAFRLACEKSDKIAAIAAVSASMTPALYGLCQPQNAVPVLMINGTADGTIPYNGSPNIIAPSVHVDSVIARWASINNTNPQPVVPFFPQIRLRSTAPRWNITCTNRRCRARRWNCIKSSTVRT